MQQWKHLIKNLKKIYKAYGGINALKESPFVHISIVLSVTTVAYNSFTSCKWSWHATPLSVLPSMIGFSLAAYALSLTIGSQKFQDVIRGEHENETQNDENKISPYIQLSSNFAHFVLVQFFALLLAIVGKEININLLIISLLGTFLFYYAISLGVATTLSVFFLSEMYDKLPKDPPKE